MRPSFLSTGTVITVVCFAAQLAAAPTRKAGEIEFERRSYKAASGEALDCELGTLFVPENRSDEASRIIGVGFARFPCTDQPPRSPPSFHLPGGPGMSFLNVIQSARPGQLERSFPELHDFLRDGDVVFVDQRGFSQRGDVLRETMRRSPQGKSGPATPHDKVHARQSYCHPRSTGFLASSASHPIGFLSVTLALCGPRFG